MRGAQHSGKIICTGTVARNMAQIPALPLSGYEILGPLSFNSFICKIWIKMLVSRAVVSIKKYTKHLEQCLTYSGLSTDTRY